MSKRDDQADRMARLARRMLGGAQSRERMLHAFPVGSKGRIDLLREVRDMTGYAERAHRQAIRLRKRASGR